MFKSVAVLTVLAVSSVAAQNASCTAESLQSQMNACDSIADVSQLKCDAEACHEALHELTEDETRQCYVDLGLGPVTDLDYYVQLDEFCHGDGADPAGQSSTTSSASGSAAGAATVGDDHEGHDHDHNHEGHDHDHDDHSSSTSASASGSSDAQSLSVSLAALSLVALVSSIMNA